MTWLTVLAVAVLVLTITGLVAWCRWMDAEERDYRRRVAEADSRYLARMTALGRGEQARHDVERLRQEDGY